MELDINRTIQQAFTSHKKNKFDDAERLYKSILDIQPNNINIHNNLGAILNKLGKFEEAEIHYKKVIELKPDYAEVYINLSNLNKNFGKFHEAEKNIKKAIEIKPNFEEAYYCLGIIKQKLNRIEEAQVCFRKAIELKADYAEAYDSLGLTLYELHKLEEAEFSFKKAIEIKPQFINAQYNFSTLLYKIGRIDEAMDILKKTLQLNPDFKPSLLLIGNIYFERGKYELALQNFDICNTESSRALSLASLYALRRVEDIYERINAQSELDSKNLSIAAFSSFIEHKEKKETANKFCNNPIDFISISNISSYIEDLDSFIKEIINELENVKIRWEPLDNTTKNGFHTGNKINLFDKPINKMKDLQSIIIEELYNYRLKFKKENCSYIKDWPSESFLSGWHVVLKKQGYQKAHIHPGGWLSGVIYLKVVPDLGRNEGAIEFSLNGNQYFDVDSPNIIYKPNVGDLILFPSSLHHKTFPYSTDTNRMIISFDLVPIIKNKN